MKTIIQYSYFMWNVENNEKFEKDIKQSVEIALKNYEDKGFKILDIEISKQEEVKNFTIKDINVRTVKFLPRNTILLKFEKVNDEK